MGVLKHAAAENFPGGFIQLHMSPVVPQIFIFFCIISPFP